MNVVCCSHDWHLKGKVFIHTEIRESVEMTNAPQRCWKLPEYTVDEGELFTYQILFFYVPIFLYVEKNQASLLLCAMQEVWILTPH